MPDESGTEMAMYVQLGMEAAVPGAIQSECMLDKDPDDEFMAEFIPSPDGATFSNFFEVTSFDFGFEIDPDSDRTAGGKASTAHSLGAAASALTNMWHFTQEKRDSQRVGTRSDGGKSGLEAWRSAKRDEWRELVFPVRADKFKFTRLIDSASPLLFLACTNSWPIEKAVLVKRLSRGQPDSTTNRLPQAYLRVEMSNGLVKSLRWDDGDIVKETCDLQFETVEIKYKQQRFDGSFDEAAAVAKWDREKHVWERRDRQGSST